MNLKETIPIIGIIIVLFGAYVAVDARYAKSEELVQFKQEFREYALENQRNKFLQPLIELELKFPEYDRPPTVQKEIFRLKEEIRKIDLKLEKLNKKENQ